MNYITDRDDQGRYITTAETPEGVAIYTGGAYLTYGASVTDAKCWVAFHGETAKVNAEALAAGKAARAKMDAENTVTLSTGTHIVPPMMAFELRQPAPHPRNGFAGTLGKRMRARQMLFAEAAELFGISAAEARTLPRLLRANKY